MLWPSPPVRELTDFQPSEIWVIQINKARCGDLSGMIGDLAGRDELINRRFLEQELRFIQTINRLLDRGVLIDSGYRHIEVHRIIMEHDLDDASILDRSASFLGGLLSYGKDRAKQFLEKRRSGLSRSSAVLSEG